ncbi:YbaB/EbfC family nucleoid-associated protein [Actinoplanes derwentensis]|uniref:YbaB/EbfC DNA-binding family protein n=1 Tax=Actinoplanes derwentensis TaxID=113562 RepID=A0A1H2C7C0_9ACTN|nr:YbaB/EbfC family nucleoid-associated protein [Actinoplanes derwentensis]GID86553.1 hypothetical protein Ade03nite_54770 [Actinoplanes derwentensis]SDT66425.1 YbaB/EbfC DNA-binding family protein [Actinoplanes derwentensis]
MADEQGAPRRSGQLEAMLVKLAEEQRKLEDFQRKMNEATTVVESSNKMVTATFDGRGELTGLTFNTTRYRTMSPTELASTMLETLRRGRGTAFGKIDEMTGGDVLPGIKFGDLAAGKVDINDVVGTLLTSAINLPDLVENARKANTKKEAGRADG